MVVLGERGSGSTEKARDCWVSQEPCSFVCLFTRTCHFDKKYVASEIWERLAFYLVTASVWVKGDQERQ